MKTGVNKEVAGIIILVTGSSRSFMILFYFVFIIAKAEDTGFSNRFQIINIA